MKSPSPPPAPDPKETAAAQSQMNKETAIAQYGLNATNQYTPQGSIEYNRIGTWEDGTPRFSATQTYSPEQQNLYNQQTELSNRLNTIGLDQSQRIGQLLGTPVNLNNDATESRIIELSNKRLQPQLDQVRQAREADLFNRGYRPGTAGYDREMARLSQDENDARNSLLLGARGQAIQEALTERNQPINEISALMSGGQVSQPNFTSTPQAGIAPTDYIGAENNKYAADMAAYNAKQSNRNAMMGGLFGIGSALAGPFGGWMFPS